MIPPVEKFALDIEFEVAEICGFTDCIRFGSSVNLAYSKLIYTTYPVFNERANESLG